MTRLLERVHLATGQYGDTHQNKVMITVIITTRVIIYQPRNYATCGRVQHKAHPVISFRVQHLVNLDVDARIILKLIERAGRGGAELVNLVQDRHTCLNIKCVANTQVAYNVVTFRTIRSYRSSLTRWSVFYAVST